MRRVGGIAILAALATQMAAAQADATEAGATGAPLAGDRELGEYLSTECVTCHQLSGRYDGIPSIVGWPPESFTAILTDYREKRRENPVMRSIAVKFTDEEIAALAAYFGSLAPRTD
jgi:cytochrome c553